MNVAAESVEPWSRVRWATTITVVVVLHVVLVLAFSNPPPLHRRATLNTEVILPEHVAGELQALTDPTLLALGGPQSFSAIWLETPRLPPVDARWKQTPQWLRLDQGTLGDRFLAFVRSNAASLQDATFKTTPGLLPVPAQAKPTPLRAKSTMRVEGDLAHRKLLRKPDLPSWPATDLLLPSEVRVIVDARGLVVSAILLSSSGSKEADQFAMKQAWQMRFSPKPHETETEALTVGQLVFEWHATALVNDEHEADSK